MVRKVFWFASYKSNLSSVCTPQRICMCGQKRTCTGQHVHGQTCITQTSKKKPLFHGMHGRQKWIRACHNAKVFNHLVQISTNRRKKACYGGHETEAPINSEELCQGFTSDEIPNSTVARKQLEKWGPPNEEWNSKNDTHVILLIYSLNVGKD